MTGKEIARNYQIPQNKKIGKRTYYLDDVYKYTSDASSRVKGLRSMGFPARRIKVIKPGTSAKHTAVYRSTKR